MSHIKELKENLKKIGKAFEKAGRAFVAEIDRAYGSNQDENGPQEQSVHSSADTASENICTGVCNGEDAARAL